MAPQREWLEKDFYKILGVKESDTDKEITRAYRKLAKEHHPDSGGSEERFKEISAAYDVLGDPDRRKEYDEVRRLGPLSGFGNAAGQAFGDFDLGDIFGGLFNRVRGNGGAGPRAGTATRGGGPQRGRDLEAELHLDFEDAVRGITTTIHLSGEASCSVCHGTGAEPGTLPKQCPTCNGSGITADNQGLFSFSSPCPSCNGRGVLIESPCQACRGTGAERRERGVKVRIPAGVGDGRKIKMKERGGPGRNGGPPGDLYVLVHVTPHPTFGRRGDDLTTTVRVPFPTLALGGEVDVPTLEGGPVKISIKPGTQPGTTMRVRGRGVAAAKRTGDLLVTVQAEVPKTLTDKQRSALEALRDAMSGSPSGEAMSDVPVP
ncbi:MAG TPA: J domain-containing protein [Acidimicrobiales bacterium]|nr:J domain-containing protein [Acidimicrobiales bacterium]